MTLDGKFGQLLSDGNFIGTAWLLSEDLAISAYHCLVDDKKKMRTNFTIKFPKFSIDVIPDDKLIDPGLDVAILIITNKHGNNLNPLVFDMSRTPITQGDEVYILGYPEFTQKDLPHGTPIPAKVEMIDWTVSHSKSITMSYHGGVSPNVKGVSGGPLVLKSDITAAIGIMTSKYDEVESLYATSIINIVKSFPELEPLFTNSPHTDPRSNKLLIDIKIDGRVRWSSHFTPTQSADMWTQTNPVTYFSCRATRKELGDDIFLALVRLIGHTNSDCSLRGADDWKETMRVYGLDTHARLVECSVGDSTHSQLELPAKSQEIAVSVLAEEIHAALDQWILNKVDNWLVGILNGSKATHLDYSIDTALSDTMLQFWQNEWCPALKNDANLLRNMLVRLASHDEAARADGPKLICVGKSMGPEYRVLWEPCLFALAIAASGIELTPATLTRGNLALSSCGAEGHACGCEKVRNQRISITLPKTPAWRTALVLLPLLKEGFLGIYSKAQIMNQGSGGPPRIGEPGLPPVIVSSDSTFLTALSKGEAEVRAHVQGLQDELARIVKTRFGEEEAEKWKKRLAF